uniref:F-box domain-containing protein n=1 Tax=Bactrocera latifrons TaxID=174628 RepID=A0A0K8WGH3_BACLA
MLNLNDDCILYIITLLNQNDQLQLKRVCMRLNNLVNIYWHHKYKKWSKYDTNCQNEKAFLWMIYHLHDFIEDLDLGCLRTDDMDILRSYVFPNAQTLIADAEIVETNALDVFPKVFPNLHKINLVANINMNVIAKMNFLTELKLEYVCYTGDFSLQSIFTNLKLRKFSFGYTKDESNKLYNNFHEIHSIIQCQTLEEFSTNAELLNIIADKLPELRNLKLIGCFINSNDRDYESVYNKIIEIFGSRIHTLISDSFIGYFPMQILLKMPNLRKWIMKDRFVNRFDENVLAKSLTNLEELLLINIKNILPIFENRFENGDEEYMDLNIFELIGACKKLRVLGIPMEWLNVELSLLQLYNLLRDKGETGSRLEVQCFTFDSNADVKKQLTENYEDQMRIIQACYPKEEFDRYSLHYFSERLFEIHF